MNPAAEKVKARQIGPRGLAVFWYVIVPAMFLVTIVRIPQQAAASGIVSDARVGYRGVVDLLGKGEPSGSELFVQLRKVGVVRKGANYQCWGPDGEVTLEVDRSEHRYTVTYRPHWAGVPSGPILSALASKSTFVDVLGPDRVELSFSRVEMALSRERGGPAAATDIYSFSLRDGKWLECRSFFMFDGLAP